MKNTKPQKLWISGFTGRLGQNIVELLKDPAWTSKISVLGGNSSRFLFTGKEHLAEKTPFNEIAFGEKLLESEIIIDVSLPVGNAQLLSALASRSIEEKTILIATTGLDKSAIKAWRDFSAKENHRVLVAANTSQGISLMLSLGIPLALALIKQGFDYEIIETHHRLKKDAPSGTALILQEALVKAGEKKKIPVPQKPMHALRGGGVFGEHTLRLMGEEEEIIITHRAYSRTLFARGALTLCSWLIQQKPGFYAIEDVDLSNTPDFIC